MADRVFTAVEFVRETIWANPWSNMTTLLSDVGGRLQHVLGDISGTMNSDDWQIRLSCLLLLWTFANVVCVGLVWRLYGETLSHMFYNKPKVTGDQQRNSVVPEMSSSGLEDLIEKKIK